MGDRSQGVSEADRVAVGEQGAFKSVVAQPERPQIARKMIRIVFILILRHSKDGARSSYFFLIHGC